MSRGFRVTTLDPEADSLLLEVPAEEAKPAETEVRPFFWGVGPR